MPKLIFSRVRKRGEPDWLDPQTDIRRILPAVILNVLGGMEDKYGGRPDVLSDILYVHNCFRVFQIKIMEDPTPVDEQVDEFVKALAKVNKDVLCLIASDVVLAMLGIYSLFCRRDAVTDKESLHAMLEQARLIPYSRLLSPETHNAVRSELAAKVPLLVQNKTNEDGIAVCMETGEVLDHLKDIACGFMAISGNQTWEELSKACDKEFGSRPMSDQVAIALALAFPTYERPTLMVEQEKEEQNGPATEAN